MGCYRYAPKLQLSWKGTAVHLDVKDDEKSIGSAEEAKLVQAGEVTNAEITASAPAATSDVAPPARAQGETQAHESAVPDIVASGIPPVIDEPEPESSSEPTPTPPPAPAPEPEPEIPAAPSTMPKMIVRRGGNPNMRRKQATSMFQEVGSAKQLKRQPSRRPLADLFKKPGQGGRSGSAGGEGGNGADSSSTALSERYSSGRSGMVTLW